MAEFLLEIFSEEIPARMQEKASLDLKRLVTEKLTDAILEFGEVKSYVTARRLTLHIEDLSAVQPDISEERRGPRSDAPEKAIEGFIRSAGIAREQLIEREDKKGTFLYAVIDQKGKPATEVISEIMPDVIRNFPWAKSQRWGAGSLRWVRPMHNILCTLDGKVVNIDLGDISSNNKTYGHRFMAPEEIEVSSFATYRDKLEKAFVVIDRDDRIEKIKNDAKKLAHKVGLNIVSDDALLSEVAGLAEYPQVMIGEFDAEFLEVPPEALTSAMRTHQKYFSLKDDNGKLANKFIFVSNMATTDNGTKIIDGNQRVLRARLSDTKFFWDQDLKTKLADRSSKLADIVFHAKLGSMENRVVNLSILAEFIADKIGADKEKAKVAAELSKSDLVTGMVDECPELQGLMGKYFALAEGLNADVANAIADQYSPKGPSDACPSEPVSIVVALADKIDILTGFFAINEKPTGSKDPFALRRAALGIIRLILENEVRINMEFPIRRSIQLHGRLEVDEDGCLSELRNFFWDRLKVYSKDAGIAHDIIGAEFDWDFVKLISKAKALQDFLSSDDGENLLAGYKRAANILKAEEKKDATQYQGIVKVDLLGMSEELTLYNVLKNVEGNVVKAIVDEDFVGAMTALSTLREPIDGFFDKVTVNSEEENVRINRLKLLSNIRTTMNLVVDFSKIEG